ncbi:hypothetical protein GCM10009080_56730 [Cupriavidus pauculus]
MIDATVASPGPHPDYAAPIICAAAECGREAAFVIYVEPTLECHGVDRPERQKMAGPGRRSTFAGWLGSIGGSRPITDLRPSVLD